MGPIADLFFDTEILACSVVGMLPISPNTLRGTTEELKQVDIYTTENYHYIIPLE